MIMQHTISVGDTVINVGDTVITRTTCREIQTKFKRVNRPDELHFTNGEQIYASSLNPSRCYAVVPLDINKAPFMPYFVFNKKECEWPEALRGAVDKFIQEKWKQVEPVPQLGDHHLDAMSYDWTKSKRFKQEYPAKFKGNEMQVETTVTKRVFINKVDILTASASELLSLIKNIQQSQVELDQMSWTVESKYITKAIKANDKALKKIVKQLDKNVS